MNIDLRVYEEKNRKQFMRLSTSAIIITKNKPIVPIVFGMAYCPMTLFEIAIYYIGGIRAHSFGISNTMCSSLRETW